MSGPSGMTVAELMERLKPFPPDMRVQLEYWFDEGTLTDSALCQVRCGKWVETHVVVLSVQDPQ